MKHELERARVTKDSYYRYHLLRLTEAKDEAIRAAQQAVRDAWATHAAEAKAASQTVFDTQRATLVDFIAGLRTAYGEKAGEDRTDLERAIGVRRTSLDAFLEDETARLEAALDQCRDTFKETLLNSYGEGGDGGQGGAG